MYTANGLWEDAMRVAKLFGGINGSKQVRICPNESGGKQFGFFNHHPLLQNVLKLINERHCTMIAADLNFCTLCLALVYYNLAGEKIHLVIRSQSFIPL
jgi:hypothetical protein